MITKYFRLCLVFLVCCFSSVAAENTPPPLQGNWSGVWYVGMSSGKVNLRFDAQGPGRINFTNFEEFSDSDIPITKLSLEGDTVKFSVPSKLNAEFAIVLKLKQDSKLLDGGGKFDGAGAKIVFNKVD
jgi:hypothetical protein